MPMQVSDVRVITNWVLVAQDMRFTTPQTAIESLVTLAAQVGITVPLAEMGSTQFRELCALAGIPSDYIRELHHRLSVAAFGPGYES